MIRRMIAALTFDFWDTIAIDDSDEPKRAQLGLPSKPEARLRLFVSHIRTYYPHIPPEQAVAAYRTANERFREAWHNEHRTPRVHQRLYFAYECLGLKQPPGQYARIVREVDQLAREIETMEIRIPPDFAPQVQWVVEVLAQEYTLAIISDTIHTTGSGIRHLLYQQGLLPYFTHFFFSDEIGMSKPAPGIFRRAAMELGLPPQMVAHVGDRESNDVAGPLAIGMRAVLFTGIVDRGSARTRAHAICRRYAELPGLLRRLR